MGVTEHISKQFETDLDTTRTRVLQMGGLIEAQILAAIQGFVETMIDDPAEAASPAVVKVIAALDDRREVAFARDFVRQLPPGAPEPHWRHVNVYAYRRPALERFARLPVSENEAERRLEPMRALDNGLRVVAVRVDSTLPTVDMPEDLERVRLLLRKTP